MGPDILEVIERLENAYGTPHPSTVRDPLETAILTILSQNTNDANRDRAWRSLRSRYPTWDKLLKADIDDVADTIKPAGLASVKARYIKGLLQHLSRSRDELTLEFLHDLEPQEANRYLMSIEGIGPKTAAVILLFALGRPAFPVDTHVFRVSRRLGLVSEGMTRERSQQILTEMVPEEKHLSLHLNLITHGKRVCKARRPLCDVCVLRDICDYADVC